MYFRINRKLLLLAVVANAESQVKQSEVGGKSRQVNIKGSGSVMAGFNYVLILVCFYCFFFPTFGRFKIKGILEISLMSRNAYD